jgi:hypothetical protein
MGKDDKNRTEFTSIREDGINWDEKTPIELPKIETIDLGCNLNKIRNYLSEINFNEPGIYILNLQPGVGKTHAIKAFLKKQESFLMVTASHKLLTEEYEKIANAKHWEGMGPKKCEKYDTIKKLHASQVPITMICNLQHCDKRKCAYWKQFNTKKAVAPIQYLPTNRVLSKEGTKKFKFGILVVDEALKEFKITEIDMEQINRTIRVIKKYNPSIQPHFNNFIKLLNNNELPTKDQAQKLNNIRNDALSEAIKDDQWEDIEEITKFNPYELRKYAYYHSIHQDIPLYPEPFLYYVLDLALQGVPVIFLDASFDKKAFEEILNRYIYENTIQDHQLLLDKKLNPIGDLKIKIYQSHIQNKEVIIHRMDKNNFYYRTGIFNYPNKELTANGEKTIKKLRSYIKRAKRKYTTVGIITYMRLVTEFNDLGETDYFYNLRGSNKIKDVEALFIIGTPHNTTDDVVESYNNLSLTNYKTENLTKLTYTKINGKYYPYDPENKVILTNGLDEKKPNPLIYDYEDLTQAPPLLRDLNGNIAGYDYSITEYDYNLSESEKYQAVHRARPLIKEKSPAIFIFGDVPDEVRKEFTIKTLNNKETDLYFEGPEFKGIYPLQLSNLITKTFYKNTSSKSLDIAKELNLYKDPNKSTGYNTTFVTQIIKGDVNPKQIKIIHEALKNDMDSDVKSIKKSSKADEKFIKDCILYAKEGNFIKKT